MNKRPKLIALILVAAIGLICIAGTKVSQMTRTRILTTTSRFYTVTQDVNGRFYSRYITAPDLATNLSQWNTNSGGAGLSSLPSYVATNTDNRRIYFSGLTTTNAIQSAGGNARSTYAVDLQVSRNGNTNVASGDWSSIGGGSNNMASGSGAAVIGGIGNEASGTLSLAAGSGSLARDSWAIALGFDNMVKNGSDYGTAIGGTDNILFNSLQASIYGGGGNIISNSAIGTIIGSENSRIWGDYGAILGGSDNVASNTFATAIGDRNRSLGHYGTVIGHRVTNTTPYMIRIGHDIYTLTIDSNALITVPGGILSSNSIGVWGGDLNVNAGIVYASAGLQSAGSLDITGDAKLDGQVQLGSKRIKVLVGDGSPESVVTAAPQSFYFQTNVTTGIGWWIKTNGTSNTGWWRLTINPDFTTEVANTLTNSLALSLSNATMKPVVLRKNNRMLEMFGLEAGANISLTPNGSNIVVAAPASSLSDGDKGDITVSGAGAVWNLDIDSVTDAKLRESAAYSVIGRASGTIDNPADIVAAADTVLGRSGSGNVAFNQITPGQIADDAVMFSKMTNIATQRLIGRGSAGTGDPEPITLGSGFTISSGALSFNGTQVGSSLFLRSTNMWADGGVSTLYSNLFLANAGGLTNILITNILDGQTLHLWIAPAPGVTVGFPQFSANDYTDGAVVTPVTNAWSHVLIDRRNTTTNIQVITASMSLAMGLGLSASTNYATRTVTITASAGAGPFIASSAGGIGNSTIIRDLYVGSSSFPGVIYAWNDDQLRQDLFFEHQGSSGFFIGTNDLVMSVRGTSIVPGNNGMQFGNSGQHWWTSYQDTINASNLVTTSIYYTPANYNGSNGVTATALTNNWDISLNTFKAVTNVVGTNLTYNLSNVTQGASIISAFKGNGGYSNTVTLLSPGNSGTNIVWMNWSTNGNYDFQVKPNYTYTLQLFAERNSNVLAWVSTDDPWVPLSAIYLNGVNVGLSNVIATNLTFINGAISNLVSTNILAINGGVSNLVATNLSARLGVTGSNVTVGGSIMQDFTLYTNHSGAINFTNLGTFVLKGHSLTNAGDRAEFTWMGRFANAVTTTNQLQIGYGSQTNILDTGLQTASNTAYKATIAVTRLAGAGTSQLVECRLEWGLINSGVTGVPWTQTNAYVFTTETNGIDTTLRLAHACRRFFGVTNEMIMGNWRRAAQ